MKLDRIDRRILDLLQADNQIPNVALAEKVGLSPPACSRRTGRLRAEGVIARDVSLVDPQKVGKTLSVVLTVTLEVQRRELLDSFAERIRTLPAVQHCYMVAGAVDFVIFALLDDMQAYAAFIADALGNDRNVKSYETWFVLSEVKNDSRIPLAP